MLSILATRKSIRDTNIVVSKRMVLGEGGGRCIRINVVPLALLVIVCLARPPSSPPSDRLLMATTFLRPARLQDSNAIRASILLYITDRC